MAVSPRRIVVALACGSLSLFATIAAMGAGHGTNVVGWLLIPWAMLLMRVAEQPSMSVFVLAALIQFQVYAAVAVGARLFFGTVSIFHFVLSVWGIKTLY